jgi:3'(2'), 5'-bisphosphate nucleotidase
METGVTIAADEAERLLDDLAELAALAAAAILARPAAQVAHSLKADNSPVTAADEAAEVIILDGLQRLLPRVPVVAEESNARGARPSLAATYLLVDPLDGTKEFLAGRDDYTVNIAIVTEGIPIAGVIAAPALGSIWRGANGRAQRATLGNIREWSGITTRAWPASGPVVAVSRSHLDAATEAYLGKMPPLTRKTCGSSIKFCEVAQGNADLYPRLGPTSEWDIAAGHAILVAAGGCMTRPDGKPLKYGEDATGFRVPSFIAWGDPQRARMR